MVGRPVKPKEEPRPVSTKASITTAFARRKSCPVCGNNIHPAIYREHLDDCQLKRDDSDCEVLEVLSGDEARAQRAGAAIEIDDNADEEPIQHDVGQEENDIADISTQPIEEPPTQTRRRSARILTERTRINGEIKQEDNPEQTQQRRSMAVKRIAPPSPSRKRLEGEGKKKRPAGRKEKNKRNRDTTPLPTAGPSGVVDSPAIEVPPTPQTNGPALVDVKQEVPTATSLIKSIDDLLAAKPAPKLELNVDIATLNPLEEEPVVARGAPYFVTFALRMLKRVFSTPMTDNRRYDESFWMGDMRTFARFIQLTDSARQLFMRMFLRKRAWLTSERLRQRYPELAETLDESLRDLEEHSFVDSNLKSPPDLETSLKLLPLPNMKNVAKLFKLDMTKGKSQLAEDLIAFSVQQKGIFGQKGAVAARMLKAVNRELGPCHRVNEEASLLFKAVFTLYTPSETNSALAIDTPNMNIEQAVLFTMLQVENGSLRYPAPSPCPSIIDIYRNKKDLMMYIEAKEVELSMLSLMSCHQYDEALKLGAKAKESLANGEGARLIQPCSSLPACVRRFTCPWVLVRCVSHAASVMEKQKKYALAINWQRFLLNTQLLYPFCMDSRGAWWDRLALNLHSHMKEKEEALEAITEGMRDSAVKEKDRLLLQDRAVRISQGDFLEQVVIMETVKREISANVLSKELGEQRVNRFVVRSENGDLEECSVEEVARRHYLDNEDCDNGVHAEGSIWHTALGLLFHDIIFTHEPSHVWLSELQPQPLDLNCDILYELRQNQLEDRLSWLERVEETEMCQTVREIWSQREGETNSEINWKLFETSEECCSFLTCCPRGVLVGVFRRLLGDYRATRSGFPDLTMWNTRSNTVAVVEVKGPGDRLSTKQRLWLHHFRRLGARAEVCHVIAKNGKELK